MEGFPAGITDHIKHNIQYKKKPRQSFRRNAALLTSKEKNVLIKVVFTTLLREEENKKPWLCERRKPTPFGMTLTGVSIFHMLVKDRG